MNFWRMFVKRYFRFVLTVLKDSVIDDLELSRTTCSVCFVLCPIAPIIGNFVFYYFGFNRSDGFSHAHAYAFGFFIALLIPKMISKYMTYSLIYL